MAKQILDGGSLEKDHIVALEDRAKIFRVMNDTRPKKRPILPMVALVGLTLTVFTILFFVRLGESTIAMDVVASEFSFQTNQAGSIWPTLDVKSIGLSPLGHIRFRAAEGPLHTARERQSGPSFLSAKLTVKAEDGQAGISVPGFTLAPGATISLTDVSADKTQKLILEGGDVASAPFRVDVVGRVNLDRSTSPREHLTFESSSPVLFTPGASRLQLKLEYSERRDSRFLGGIAISKLTFVRTEALVVGTENIARLPSSVLAGEFVIEGYSDRRYTIRSGEVLGWEKFVGTLESISVARNGLSLVISGRVRGMTTGVGSLKRSLMPTLLEWLKDQYGLWLLWGGVAYLVPLLYGWLKWWGVYD